MTHKRLLRESPERKASWAETSREWPETTVPTQTNWERSRLTSPQWARTLRTWTRNCKKSTTVWAIFRRKLTIQASNSATTPHSKTLRRPSKMSRTTSKPSILELVLSQIPCCSSSLKSAIRSSKMEKLWMESSRTSTSSRCERPNGTKGRKVQ